MIERLRHRLGESTKALDAVVRSADLRRVEAAWATFNLANWATTVATAVYAFQHGGATAVGAVAAIRMGSTAIASPLLSVLADRLPRRAVMAGSSAARAGILGATAAAVWADAPRLAVFALTIVAAGAGSVFRPAQAAIVPSLAERPEDLTAANVAGSTIESVGMFAGPALGGLLLAVSGVGAVFAATAAAFACSALLVVRVRREPRRAVRAKAEPRHFAREVAAGFDAIVREPRVRLVVGLVSAQTLVSGALNVLLVAAALELLHMGRGGVGYLNAAIGAGGLLGALALLGSLRRPGLALATGVLLWGSPLVLIGIWPHELAALLLLVAVGIGNSLVDVPSFTLLQRAAPEDVLARVFGAIEAAVLGAIALGAGVAPVLIHLAGLRGALVAVGAFLPVVAALLWQPLVRLEAATPQRRRERELLEAIPLFAPLGSTVLETVAAELVPVAVPAGGIVVREGEPGDRFYVVDAGRLEATQDGRHLRDLADGDFFGEIALLREVPRTATVTAASPSRLLALERDEFVAAVTGHPDSRRAAEAAIATRLGSLRPSVASP